MPVIEVVIAIGLIVLAVRIVPPWLERRAEARRLSERRKQQLQAAKSAADVVSMLMVDRDLAREVLKELGDKVAEEERNH